MTEISEIWVDISGYEGLYQVSNFGRIKSLPKIITNGAVPCIKKERILSPSVLRGGYVNIVLRKDNKSRNHNVHRLVAENLIENTNTSFNCVNHKDCNKQNNRVENLEWCNHSINCLHAYDNGISNKPGHLTNNQAIEIREKLSKGFRQVDLAKEYGVSESVIYGVYHKRTYKRADIKIDKL